jgi:hypothetical protein
MTIAERVPLERSAVSGLRLLAGWAFLAPPLALLAVAAELAFSGGSITPEEWQPVAAGLTASLFVLAAVGAVPSLPRAAAPALSALAALVIWSGASLLWTQSPDATSENIVRLAMLAAAMVIGAAYASRRGSALALACGLASLGGLVAAVVDLKLLAGTTSIFGSSRLSWPIQDANADAAVLWLTLPALVAFATARRLTGLGRGLCALVAGLCLSAGLLTQSRGGAFALVAGLAVAFAIAQERARFALTTLAVVAPAALVVLTAGDPSDSAGAARGRGLAILAAALASAGLVGALSAFEGRLRDREARLAVGAWGVTLVLAAALGLAATSGRPDLWLSSRWHEFRSVDSAPAGLAHFSSGASTRNEYWRVAWRAFEERPVLGVGSGAFSVPWYRLRSINDNISDAHSWEASAFAETGIVGLLLTGAALLLPFWSARRGRGRDGWAVATVALGGAAAYFVVHASFDWLFRVPAVAIPGFLVLGALAGAGGAERIALPGSRQRVALAAVALVAGLIAIPAYLSTADSARAEQRAAVSPNQALGELDWAARLNPFAARPLEVRSSILGSLGRHRAAVAAARETVERDPNDWTGWLALRQAEMAAGQREAAQAAYGRAHALNPRGSLLALP